MLVVRPRSVLRIDPQTGEQEVVSSGGLFEYLVDVVGGQTDVYVSDVQTGSIVHVNPETGAQSLLLDGLDLGGTGLLAGGGLTMTAEGMLLVAGVDGLTQVDPFDGTAEIFVQGMEGPGIFGNHLDVMAQFGSDDVSPGIYYSKYSESSSDHTMDIYWLGTNEEVPSLIYSAPAVIGPGFNGSLAIHPDGDVFFAHAGEILRIDPTAAPDVLVGEAPSSLGGFGGIAIDGSGITVVIEHCGPEEDFGCTAEGIRITEGTSGEVILGGEGLQFGLELHLLSFECSDGIDNDGDLLMDEDDPGCFGPIDTSERESIPEPESWLLGAAVLCTLSGIARIRRSGPSCGGKESR